LGCLPGMRSRRRMLKVESPFKAGTTDMKRCFARVSLVVVLSVLCQCSGMMSTKIGDIRNNPRRYADKEVTLSGTVTSSFSLVVLKYFTLGDGTGDIPVVTQRPLPKEGERVTVKGTVREAFSIGSESLLVIVEKPAEAG
jgi:hypothetical protein